MRKIVWLVLLLAVTTGGYFGYRLIWGKPLSIHHFADRVMLQRLYNQPELITFLGIIENTPLDFHSNRFSDLSPDSMNVWRAEDRVNYRRLLSYRQDTLDRQEQLTFEFMTWYLGGGVAASEYPYHFDNVFYKGPYPVNQISGAHLEPLQILDSMQQIVDLESSRRYLDRVAAIPDYIDSLIAALEYRDKLNANPPQLIFERALKQVSELVSTASQDWSIHTTLVQAAEDLQLEKEDQQTLSARSLKLLEQAVIPAYGRLEKRLTEIKPRAPLEVGVWNLPDGESYYQSLLYVHASTRMTPDDIHNMGLTLVDGFRKELMDALVSLGYEEGSLAERIEQMMNEPGARYENSDAGRQEIIDDFTRIGNNLESATFSAFGMRPAAPVVVERVPVYAQDGEAMARYSPPSLDGSRPGRFMINLRAPHEIERHGMVTLSAHEAIPGHHFEVALTQELEELPMIRRNALISSYSEGWALYVEHLVHELDVHDKRSNIGRLQSMLFRATRLVVDTGIHAKRWSRDKAISYMRDNTGIPLNEVTSEVERYIAWPGQACSYMLGMQSILASREAARARLGPAFNLPDFHDAVLAGGPLPIEVLESQLELLLR